ncbi:MAG TPA: HAMP domain-containing sensor histidine kinase [Solirubrobacteraceae bacterium]|nr:HAMP domain-containing sensor histidine kinase [Solirubrobacteraceae bacterium]
MGCALYWRARANVSASYVVRERFERMPLLWRVFLTNALVFAVGLGLLALAPVTVSIPIAVTELIVLVCGTVALLVIDLLLLRPAFQPLHRLAEAMREIDPLRPGRRAPVVGGPDVRALARTFNEMLDRLETERRDSARQALIVQEGERQRVARELHDEVGQTLTAMMLQIESLAAKIPADLRDELDELRETTRLGAEDVRRIAVRLRPEALEDLGLQSALSALATSFGEHAGVRVERNLERILPLSQEQELVIYRVAQEALTNVARHAQATTAEVTLQRTDGDVVLRVCDDGLGLPATAETASTGIRGMRERAMLIGAHLSIAPAVRGGTEVVLRVPVES